jgi:UDPglucose--hexose-1-phosphate uridylyltransferase
MYELALRKPDGRRLTLYSRRPIDPAALSPLYLTRVGTPAPQLRWHPLRGEWVVYAPDRQQRTFLPPPQYDPLLPVNDPAAPSELPVGNYDVAVFDNLFPSMQQQAPEPASQIVPTAPANGHCEVIVFTQDPQLSLGRLPAEHLDLVLQVWQRRTEAAAAMPQIKYLMPFENRGAEVGVTLHHPHGQIYGFPFVPPTAQRIHAQELQFHARHQRALLESLIEQEIADGRRILYVSEHAVAFVPAWARYPYEAWIATRNAVPDFPGLTPTQRHHLRQALQTVLLKYDALWGTALPYVMAWYQAPFDDSPRGAYHLHAECFPAYRMPGRLKYLAGTELAAGTFVNDTLPEEKALELQQIKVDLPI